MTNGNTAQGKRNGWKRAGNALFLLVLIIGTALIIRRHNTVWQEDRGTAFGTVYTIKYQSNDNLKAGIEEQLRRVDASLSMFNPQSVISRVNRGEEVELDSMFLTVFARGMEVAANTGGLYDITVAPLCNAWGFGFKQGGEVTPSVIDSLLQFVGYGKVSLRDSRIVKSDPRCQLDCGSIAKGFGCDAVASFLRRQGVQNFMVEIGGEVMAGGKNSEGQAWRIGINKPVDDTLGINRDIQTVVRIENSGVATSGNYRNFYIKDGKRYSHTINPLTGYPVAHSLLSATVIADDCMTADAYATAFMAMGLDAAMLHADTARAVKAAYFISDDGHGGYKVDMTRDMGLFLEE